MWALFLIVLMSGSLLDATSHSCEANVFVTEDLTRRPSIPSPDGRYRAVLAGMQDSEVGALDVYDRRTRLKHYRLKDLSGGLFLKWAPDSRAFYLMWSNGGMLGGYELRVFQVSEDEVREMPTSRTAEKRFQQHHPCPRGHNVFPVRWVDGSTHLLLALQVFPTSDCGRDMGRYKGFLVRTGDGSVLRQYGQKELMGIWPSGCPSAIYPTAFWGTEQLAEAKKKEKKGR